ncbi:MAG TPA: hypothetical protein VLZ77_02020 [Acidimicrobiales bacterium]|nr:hypothetical protein [Acidimicrobiales bacterium]
MQHLTDETTTPTPDRADLPFVALESLRAEPSTERGEWVPPVASPGLPGAADDSTWTSLSSTGLSSTGLLLGTDAGDDPEDEPLLHQPQDAPGPRHRRPSPSASIWDAPSFADVDDPSHCIGLTPARMTTLDLMRSLEERAPRGDWHYEDVMMSAPIGESVERLATLDTISSFDLVASLESAASDIARRTDAPRPTATLSRAERRRRQPEEAGRRAPTALPEDDGPSPAPRVGAQAAALATAAITRGRDLLPRVRRHASTATAPPLDQRRPHHRHSAATAVGAVAASVLGVLTAALAVGGGGSPHDGLQTAGPTLSGGASTTGGQGGGAPSGTPGSTATHGGPGAHGLPGVHSLLTTFFGSGAGSTSGRGVGAVHGTAVGASGGSGGAGAPGAAQAPGGSSAPGAGGSGSSGSSGTSGGASGTHGGGGSGTTSSGSGSGSGSAGSGGTTHSSGGSGSNAGSGTSPGTGSSTGTGSGQGSSGSSGSGGGLPLPPVTVPTVTIPPVTVPTVTIPSVPAPALPALGTPSSGGSAPPGVLGTVTGLL